MQDGGLSWEERVLRPSGQRGAETLPGSNQSAGYRATSAGPAAGQPTLARQLRLGVFAALDQRIATRYQLAPMDLAESAQYLRHHLALVGRTDPLIADDAIARLDKASLGLPRALNNAAIAALIATATAGKALGRRRLRQKSRSRTDSRLIATGFDCR
jgi:hypothetical protein